MDDVDRQQLEQVKASAVHLRSAGLHFQNEVLLHLADVVEVEAHRVEIDLNDGLPPEKSRQTESSIGVGDHVILVDDTAVRGTVTALEAGEVWVTVMSGDTRLRLPISKVLFSG